MEDGLISRAEISSFPVLPEERVDFQAVEREKEALFRTAYDRFNDSDEFAPFCE